MRALRANGRPGMTLIELLVVISLIILLVALGLMISPRLAEDQRSVRTADLISGWLLMCKNRAYRDQQTRGIRLVVGADGHAHEMVLVERPEDFRGGTLQVPAPQATLAALPPGVPPSATAFIHGRDLTNGNPPDTTAERIADGGDFLVFDSLEPIPYNSHRIYEAAPGSPGYPYVCYYPPNPAQGMPLGGTRIVCATYDFARFSIINGGAPVINMPSDQFRIVRQPRPLVGEPTLQLPRDMAVDLTAGLPGGTILPGAGLSDQFDLLFSPRGQIQGNNSRTGKIILRLRNVTRDPTDGDQILVVIYTRTGVISAHPVNVTPGQDPYSFVLDGASSGF